MDTSGSQMDFDLESPFFLVKHTFSFTHLLFRSLRPCEVQHHKDYVANGVYRKVALEFGTNHATLSTGLSYLPPDHPGFVLSASKNHCVVFALYTHAHLLPKWNSFSSSGINIFNFKQGRVFSSVPETSIMAFGKLITVPEPCL